MPRGGSAIPDHAPADATLRRPIAPRRRRGAAARPGRFQPLDGVGRLVERELGGLERAVLQLEIGAGRDSATARAALRLRPGDYARHREQGLGKLRAAIAGLVRSRVCEHHLDAVALAATGDRAAAAELAAGPGRCRACAREAERVRAAVHQRLALAPAPLGPVAAAIGALKSLFGGSGAGGGAAAAMGAKAAAGVVALMVAAGGGAIAVAERDTAGAKRAGQSRSTEAAPAVAEPAARAVEARRTARRPARTVRVRRAASTPAPAAAAEFPTRSAPPPQQAASDPVERVAGTVEATVERVERTAGDVVSDLPVDVLEPPAVDKLVDDAADDVGALLPAP